MIWDHNTFKTRVAGRMFSVFFVATLVPVLAFSVYAYLRVGAQLERDAISALSAEAKTAGMAIFERLGIAHSQLRILSTKDNRDHSSSSKHVFTSWGYTTIEAADLSKSEKSNLSSSGSVLLRFVPERGERGPRLYLALADRIAFGELRPEFVFTPERRRHGDRYWIEVPNSEMVYAYGDDEASHAMLAARQDTKSRSAFEMEGSEGREVAISWPVFLERPFGLNEIHVGLARTEQEIYRPIEEFKQVFPVMVLLCILVATAIALRQVRRTLVPLDALTVAAESISRGTYDHRVEIRTDDEFGSLGGVFNEMAAKIESNFATLEKLHAIGRALSEEESVRNLLRKIVYGAVDLLSGKACAVFLFDDKAESAAGEPRVVQAIQLNTERTVDPLDRKYYPSFEAKSACASGEALVAEVSGDLTPGQRQEWLKFDDAYGISIGSLLTVPMRMGTGEVLGALVVIRDSTGSSKFTDEDLGLLKSLSSQAAIAIQQTRSVESLRALFEGLIQLTVRAIDEKSAYTGDHCRKVPILTEIIADAANHATTGRFKDFELSSDERYELKIAALLHDCGKMVTPVHVMDKATKLEGILDQVELVRLRAEIIARDFLATDGNQTHNGGTTFDDALKSDLEFIEGCNIGGEFMSTDAQQRVSEIRDRYTWRDASGADQALLTEAEVSNLQISRGTLNAEEREIISRHVVTTVRLLNELPFPKELRNVPSIAGAHHEMVNGTGYPLGLSGAELTMQGRILCMADIFEALTAKDRPYKQGKTLTESLAILERMTLEGHLDPDLYELFVEERLYLKYAANHMSMSQIDGEHSLALDLATEPWA